MLRVLFTHCPTDPQEAQRLAEQAVAEGLVKGRTEDGTGRLS